jgi:hypothetical protein
MIVAKEKKPARSVEGDLTGPEGSAFVLIGYANKWARQLGLDGKEIQAEMMSGDYEHLLSVIEKNFGEYVTLYR